jgi:hypothetical protein
VTAPALTLLPGGKKLREIAVSAVAGELDRARLDLVGAVGTAGEPFVLERIRRCSQVLSALDSVRIDLSGGWVVFSDPDNGMPILRVHGGRHG